MRRRATGVRVIGPQLQLCGLCRGPGAVHRYEPIGKLAASWFTGPVYVCDSCRMPGAARTCACCSGPHYPTVDDLAQRIGEYVRGKR